MPLTKPEQLFSFNQPEVPLEFTGERYCSGLQGPIRHEHYHRYLYAAQFCIGKDVLDIACGEGYGTALLGKSASSVHGIDLDHNTVEFATKTYCDNNVSFSVGNAETINLNKLFDVIISFETIEHLIEQGKFLKNIQSMLKPNGMVIISSPDKDIYNIKNEYINEYHLKELTRHEFKNLMNNFFSYTQFMEQEAVVGSLICQEGGADTHLKLFTSEDGFVYSQSDGVPHAHYIIALASDSPLPKFTTSILQDQSWIRTLFSDINTLKNLIEKSEQSVCILETTIKNSTEKINKLEEEKKYLEDCVFLLTNRQQEAAEQLEIFEENLKLTQHELNAVYKSRSWRLTKPARFIGNLRNRLLKALRID